LENLYSVDELKDFLDRTKHTVSPAYSPTLARECPHIKMQRWAYAGSPNALNTKLNKCWGWQIGLRSTERQDFSDDLQPSEQVLEMLLIIRDPCRSLDPTEGRVFYMFLNCYFSFFLHFNLNGPIYMKGLFLFLFVFSFSFIPINLILLYFCFSFTCF